MIRHVRWIPFAFLAGDPGFAIFAPYAAVMMIASVLVERRSRAAGTMAEPA